VGEAGGAIEEKAAVDDPVAQESMTKDPAEEAPPS
jgi:hypothetical protein